MAAVIYLKGIKKPFKHLGSIGVNEQLGMQTLKKINTYINIFSYAQICREHAQRC